MTRDRRREHISSRVHGGTLGVGHTFSTITDILSFLSGKHGHAVCFEILVELPRIGMEAAHSTGISGLSSEMLPEDCSTKCHHALCQLGKQILSHTLSKL